MHSFLQVNGYSSLIHVEIFLCFQYNKLLEKERELRLGLASTEFAGPYLEQPRSGSQSDNPMHRVSLHCNKYT